MICARHDCENIMCDLYSYKYGYIYRECFLELSKKRQDIDNFMRTPKKETINDDSWEIELTDIFHLQFS